MQERQSQKQQQIQWRRAKLIELSSHDHNQSDISRPSEISQPTIIMRLTLVRRTDKE